MRHALARRILLLAAAVLPAACGEPTKTTLGTALTAADGSSYYWTAELGAGRRTLWHRPPGGQEPVALDEGTFANVIGPVASPGGAAWAVLEDDGWSVHQVGVSARVASRRQGAASALAAAWALERITAGHVPGNAADLAQVGIVARSGAWPQP